MPSLTSSRKLDEDLVCPLPLRFGLGRIWSASTRATTKGAPCPCPASSMTTDRDRLALVADLPVDDVLVPLVDELAGRSRPRFSVIFPYLVMPGSLRDMVGLGGPPDKSIASVDVSPIANFAESGFGDAVNLNPGTLKISEWIVAWPCLGSFSFVA